MILFVFVIYSMLVLFFFVLPAVFLSEICRRAGVARKLALLMLVPFVNIVFLVVLPFMRWPFVPSANGVGLTNDA